VSWNPRSGQKSPGAGPAVNRGTEQAKGDRVSGGTQGENEKKRERKNLLPPRVANDKHRTSEAKLPVNGPGAVGWDGGNRGKSHGRGGE